MPGLSERVNSYHDECETRSTTRASVRLWLVKSERKPSSLPARKTRYRQIHRYPDVADTIVKRWTDRDMTRLERAAKHGSTGFLDALRVVDWRSRPASDFIRAIDLSLRVGAHLAARTLATEGAEIHFDNEELQKYARILAPPTITNKRPSIKIGPRANVEWLRANRSDYKGKWIALKSGELVGSADSRHELTIQVGQTKGTGILITYI